MIAAVALIAAGSLLGGGSYIATGDKYEFVLANTGSVSWRSFELAAPQGITFVGGTTGNEGSATCTVGPETQIACGPLAVSTMPPQGHITFVATVTTPATCSVAFELLVSTADGAPYADAGPLNAAPGCAPRALTLPVLRAVGHTLRATPPTWSSPPSSVRYRWERCRAATCMTIKGATRRVLVLTRRDAGHTIRLVVTATIGGEDVRAISRRMPVTR